MQESLQASATGAPASFATSRSFVFRQALERFIKGCIKGRKKEEGTELVKVTEGWKPKNQGAFRKARFWDAFICCLTKYTILSILKLRFDF